MGTYLGTYLGTVAPMTGPAADRNTNESRQNPTTFSAEHQRHSTFIDLIVVSSELSTLHLHQNSVGPQ
ncbi:hypothetical protein CHU98_g11511 [Xylaria longipes]|nr:hypothetical protein CHU98_g11511 [Xylaria longipes]